MRTIFIWPRIGTGKVEKYKDREFYWCPHEYDHSRNLAPREQVVVSHINHCIMNALIGSHEKV
jgi:hypothetical protein